MTPTPHPSNPSTTFRIFVITTWTPQDSVGKAGGFLELDWSDGSPTGPLQRRSFQLHKDLAAEFGAEAIGYRPVASLSMKTTVANQGEWLWLSGWLPKWQKRFEGRRLRTCNIHRSLECGMQLRVRMPWCETYWYTVSYYTRIRSLNPKPNLEPYHERHIVCSSSDQSSVFGSASVPGPNPYSKDRRGGGVTRPSYLQVLFQVAKGLVTTSREWSIAFSVQTKRFSSIGTTLYPCCEIRRFVWAVQEKLSSQLH